MSYNDQDSHHLLAWVNKERLFIGQTNKIYSFQQLQFSSLIPLLFNQIDHHYFHHLLQVDFDFKTYLLAIQKYLTEVEDLKFRRHQRQILIEQQSISQLVKLTLFLIMRHQIKKEFVPRILQLEEQTQMYLMCEIRRVESWLQNRVQIKQVHQTIEKLQEENQCLNNKLKEIEAKNIQMQTIRSQLQQENQKAEYQHKKNTIQKGKIIDELGLGDPKEYMSMYKDLIAERNELTSSHRQLQSQITNLTEQNQQMRDKITQNAFIIDHLTEEINKYKQVYSRLKKSSLSTKMDKENIDVTSATFESVRMVQSVQCCKDKTYEEHNHAVKQFQHEEIHLKKTTQNCQQDLTTKLHEMYAKIGVLNERISNLQSHNQIIVAKNKKKQRIIQESCEQFEQFSFNYSLSINR